MATFPKSSKKQNRFGIPISKDETNNVLDAPEHAPANPESLSPRKARGKTGRTEPFNTRVTKEFNEEFERVRVIMNLKKVELLEASLNAIKEKNKL